MPPAELPYTERGTGEPVLLIPGTGFPVSGWDRFGHLLAERRRVIAYERRGFTAAAPEPAGQLTDHAHDAAAVLRRAGAEPAQVIGWSGGGLVALALAIEHPASCRSLLLIEPSVHGLRAVTLSAVAMTLRAEAARLVRGQRAGTDLTYRWTFDRRDRHRSGWAAMPDAWRDHVLTYAAAVAAEQRAETTLRQPSRAALAAVDQPTSIVIGEQSQPYFHRIARHLHRTLPHADLHPVPDAGHAVHLDAPDALLALID